MSENTSVGIEGSDEIVDKLEASSEHLERSEELRNEAEEGAKELVRSELNFDANLTVEHYEDSNSLIVKVIPKGIAEGLLEEDDIGQINPLSVTFGADFEVGTKSGERQRLKKLKELVRSIESDYEEGAPVEEVIQKSPLVGVPPSKAEEEIEKLRRKGEIYEPAQNYLRTT